MKRRSILAVGVLLVQVILGPVAMAGMPSQTPAGTVSGFVIPNTVGANEPFTFAALNVVEGEVIQVKTVEGEVVQTKKADKHGRVFLAAGLATGAYLLSAGGGKNSSPMNVLPPRQLPGGGQLTIPQIPGCFNSGQGLELIGEGMSGNAADMMVKFGETEFPVLAGTATEMKTGPIPSSACGEGPLEIVNGANGATSHLGNVVCYELTAKLAKQTLVGGEQTVLEFTFKPANYTATVGVTILSGPVAFAGGLKSVIKQIVKGSASLGMNADPSGQGPFKVAYDVHEIMGAGKTDPFLPVKPGGLLPGGVGGEKPEPAGNQKKKRCPKTKHLRDEANGWTQTERKVKDAATGKETTIYVIFRTVRCSIYKSCSKDEGHGGNCVFTGKSRCQDHDITETREFKTEQERKDSMKDTAIPDDLKTPK